MITVHHGEANGGRELFEKKKEKNSVFVKGPRSNYNNGGVEKKKKNAPTLYIPEIAIKKFTSTCPRRPAAAAAALAQIAATQLYI